MRPLLVGLAALVALSACGTAFAAGQPSAPRETVPVIRLSDRASAFTDYSGLVDSASFTVRDSEQWIRAWTAIHRPFIPPPPAPAVDFAREMVVVAALGNRPTEGYDIVVENAAEDSTGIEVGLRVSSPAPGCPVSAAMTQPVDLARIPASRRAVRFRRRNVVVPCGVR